MECAASNCRLYMSRKAESTSELPSELSPSAPAKALVLASSKAIKAMRSPRCVTCERTRRSDPANAPTLRIVRWPLLLFNIHSRALFWSQCQKLDLKLSKIHLSEAILPCLNSLSQYLMGALPVIGRTPVRASDLCG